MVQNSQSIATNDKSWSLPQLITSRNKSTATGAYPHLGRVWKLWKMCFRNNLNHRKWCKTHRAMPLSGNHSGWWIVDMIIPVMTTRISWTMFQWGSRENVLSISVPMEYSEYQMCVSVQKLRGQSFDGRVWRIEPDVHERLRASWKMFRWGCKIAIRM